MVIRDEKEYKDYEARMEKLIERGTELGDMELLSPEEKAEFTMLSEALDEYGRAYHPLPGRMSTLLTNAILTQVKERGLKQKEAAQMIGISATTFSDLLHGRRSMSFDIARSLYKVLGVPARGCACIRVFIYNKRGYDNNVLPSFLAIDKNGT